MDFEKNYLEWCELMNQAPNTRDEIIFRAGYTWHAVNLALYQSEKGKVESEKVELQNIN